MSPGEQNARAYCLHLGLDPDEIIVGWQRDKWEFLERFESERWRWYVGAVIDRPKGSRP